MSLATSTYLKKNKLSGDSKSIDVIREEFKKYGIKVSYSPDEKNRRVIFSATKQFRQKGEFDEFISECNGLVLQAGSWKPLAIPPRTIKSNIKVDIVNRGFARDEYDVYEAQDGTMITLYYYANSWRISTAKGFDVTYLKWNDRVYNQVFKEILRAKDIEISDFYTSLDTNKCYTFCFTHPAFHPFWMGKSEDEVKNITYIQSVSLETLEVSKENPFEKIPSQTKVSGIKNVRDLFRTLPKTLDVYLNTGKANFGYILRLKDGVEVNDEDIMYRHIFLESRLLQTIRHLYYNGQFNMVAREKKLDRETYIIVNSFLDKRVNDKFVKLFPQYSEQFEKLEKISVKLIKKIIDIYNFQANDSDNKTEEGTDPSQSVDKETSSAEFLLAELNKVYTLNIKEKDAARKISSFVLDPKFVEIFYYLFIDKNEE